MIIDTYSNLAALMNAELDDAILSASTRDHGVDIGDPPFLPPPTYPGLKGPRRTPRGISAIPPGAKAGTRFTSHLDCPRCGGTERVVGQCQDGLLSACLPCKRASERECQRRRRANTRKGSDHG